MWIINQTCLCLLALLYRYFNSIEKFFIAFLVCLSCSYYLDSTPFCLVPKDQEGKRHAEAAQHTLSRSESTSKVKCRSCMAQTYVFSPIFVLTPKQYRKKSLACPSPPFPPLFTLILENTLSAAQSILLKFNRAYCQVSLDYASAQFCHWCSLALARYNTWSTPQFRYIHGHNWRTQLTWWIKQ